MKLTTMKLSVPVLMFMMFQSGYGVSDWFCNAYDLVKKGRTEEAIAYVHKVHPEAIRVTDSSVEYKSEDDFMADILAKIKEFAPVKWQENEAFQNAVNDDLLALDVVDINNSEVQSVLKDNISSNFVKWLERDAGVYDEVTQVTTIYANSYVPDLEDDSYNGFEGAEGTEGTVAWFVKKYEEGQSVEENFNKLLETQHLTATGFGDELYNSVDVAIKALKPLLDGEGAVTLEQKIQAVIAALANRSINIRYAAERMYGQSVIHWIWKGDYSLDVWAKEVTGNTEAERAESLRALLYNDSADGLFENPENYVDDSDEVAFYLNLSKYRNIGGHAGNPDNPEEPNTNPEDQEAFLQKIISKILDEKAAEDPQTDDDKRNLVQNAVISVLGTELSDVLRHDKASTNVDDLEDLIQNIDENGVDEYIQTFDEAAATEVAERLRSIKIIDEQK